MQEHVEIFAQGCQLTRYVQTGTDHINLQELGDPAGIYSVANKTR